MRRVSAWRVRAAAEALAQYVVWPGRALEQNCAKDLGGIGADEYAWRANISGLSDACLLAAVRGRTQRIASLKLLRWVCEATIRKIDKELAR